MSSTPLPEPSVQPVADAPAARAERSVPVIVHRVSAALASGAISPGNVAELRRLKPEDAATPVFWKLLAEYVSPNWKLPEGGAARDAAERRWAVILNALGYLSFLDTPRRPLGSALAEAGYSELRFIRLLRASDDALADTVRKAAQFLASKAEPANLADLADLVLSDGRPWAENVRRRIARSYYLASPNL